MHDPDTLIASLGPFTLWHHDPCKDGSDSSCDHKWERPTKKQRGWLEFMVTQDCCEKVELLFDIREKCPPVVVGMCRAEILADMVHDTLGRPWGKQWPMQRYTVARRCWKSMCFLPGWHANSMDDAPDSWGFKEHRKSVAKSMAYQILLPLRPWWSKNIFHFWHWKLHCRAFWKADKADPAIHVPIE